MTCWADTAYRECVSDSSRSGQIAYDLIMGQTDIRIQHKLREGCGNLMPQQCLTADSAPSGFQGTTCTEILRTAICGGDADKFRTCVGQGQCACPAFGEVGYAEGAKWGLSNDCSTSGSCKAGCAADGQPFTGSALNSTQQSDLVAGASAGEDMLSQAIDMLAAHISGAAVMTTSNLATQSGRFKEFAVLLRRTPVR